jgi:hypothetical protein
MLKKWVRHRLRERTTWLAVLGMLGLFGIRLDPELQEYVIQGLIAASCVVAFLFPESDLVRKDELSPIDLVSRPEPERLHESVVPSHRDAPGRTGPDDGWNG